jgi:hypothetical protein
MYLVHRTGAAGHQAIAGHVAGPGADLGGGDLLSRQGILSRLKGKSSTGLFQCLVGVPHGSLATGVIVNDLVDGLVHDRYFLSKFPAVPVFDWSNPIKRDKVKLCPRFFLSFF